MAAITKVFNKKFLRLLKLMSFRVFFSWFSSLSKDRSFFTRSLTLVQNFCTKSSLVRKIKTRQLHLEVHKPEDFPLPEIEPLSILSIIYHFKLIISSCRRRRYISCNVWSPFQYYLTPEPLRNSPKITWRPQKPYIFHGSYPFHLRHLTLSMNQRNLAAQVSTQYCKWSNFFADFLSKMALTIIY